MPRASEIPGRAGPMPTPPPPRSRGPQPSAGKAAPIPGVKAAPTPAPAIKSSPIPGVKTAPHGRASPMKPPAGRATGGSKVAASKAGPMPPFAKRRAVMKAPTRGR